MYILIALATRILLVLLFLPFSALDKILNFRAAVGQAAQAVSTPWLAKTFIALGLTLEVSMSAAILTGIADRLAALILAGYCMATAVLWKRFWAVPDFKLAGPSRGRDVFWDFLKNLAVAGGFLMLTFGADASGVQRFIDHPLASSQPYAPAADGTTQP